LAHGQKADILRAALQFYRMSALMDFVQTVATSDNGSPGDLLRDTGEEALKTLRYQLAASVLAFGTEQEKAAERFRILSLMLKDKPAT
jgi:hypothetical protein